MGCLLALLWIPLLALGGYAGFLVGGSIAGEAGAILGGIIGILASLMYINISRIRAKNRDAQRLMRVNEIAKAINIYYTSTQIYPVYNGNITSSDDMSLALETAGAMSDVPVDPINSAPYVFGYQSDGSDFTISFCLETDTIQGYSQGCGNTIKP